MEKIATKFVKWDVNPLEELKDSFPYKMRLKVINKEKFTREEKDRITSNVINSCYFKQSIALHGWKFNFASVLKRYLVRTYGTWSEYYAMDKTSLRNALNVCGKIEEIIEA